MATSRDSGNKKKHQNGAEDIIDYDDGLKKILIIPTKHLLMHC